MERFLIGLSVGSGFEGVDAAAVRVAGIGLDLGPVVPAALRVAFPPVVRDIIRAAAPNSPLLPATEFVRNVADAAVHAARQVLLRTGVSSRDTFAAGFLEPARPCAELVLPWPEVADRIA